MPTTRAAGFPIGSKLLEKKWKQKEYKTHQTKMRSVKPSLDNMPPSTYPHLVLKLKRVQMEEQRQQEIDHDNHLLLQKMTGIMAQPGKLDNWNPDYEPKSLNRPFMDKIKEKVALQNEGIAKRLEAVKPTYKAKSWESDFSRKHEYVLWLRSNTTKDYELAPKPLQSSKEDNLADQDAKQLYKAIKGLLTPAEVLVKNMIRRTHKQRLETAQRFDDIYSLNLSAELRQCLGRDYEPLITCLLAEQEYSDVATIRRAIQENDVSYLVEYISTAITRSLPTIYTDYSKRYDCLITEEVKERIIDEECQLLLLALFKEDRPAENSVDNGLVEQDAKELAEIKSGRFTDEEGKFMQILNERSIAHMRSTFDKYREFSDGRSIMQSMEEDGCTKDFVDAVKTLCGCLVTGPTYWATKYYSILRNDPMGIISSLLVRTDSEMGMIRRAFKKKYGVDLIDQIVRRCGGPGTLIAQIANRGGTIANAPVKKRDAAHRSKQTSPSSTPRRVSTRPTNRVSAETMQDLKANHPYAGTSRRPLAEALKAKLETEVTKHGHDKSPAQHKRSKTVPGVAKKKVDEEIRKLMEVLDTDVVDVGAVIDMITSRSAVQRSRMAKKYQEATSKALLWRLKEVLPTDCATLLDAMFMSAQDFDAASIRESIMQEPKGDTTLMCIFIAKSPQEMKAIKMSYRSLYGQDLAEELWGEASGEKEEMLVHLAAGNRDTSTTVDTKRAALEASKLLQNEKGTLDVTHPLFKDLIIKRNFQQLEATFDEIQKLIGKPVEEALQEAELGDTQEFYVKLVQILKYPVLFTVQLLRYVVTNNIATEIARIIAPLQKVDFREIDKQYHESFDKSVIEDIQENCDGTFKDLLLSFMKHK